MFEKILYPTDFSDVSKKAMNYLAQLKDAGEEEEKVSVIVIGSHGKTNLEEMFLGSVSEKVIRQSKKPVLIIKR
jgi:muramoyltetrapeptide carboxypeptidase LdcA involved in peptidoglycan recycling